MGAVDRGCLLALNLAALGHIPGRFPNIPALMNMRPPGVADAKPAIHELTMRRYDLKPPRIYRILKLYWSRFFYARAHQLSCPCWCRRASDAAVVVVVQRLRLFLQLLVLLGAAAALRCQLPREGADIGARGHARGERAGEARP